MGIMVTTFLLQLRYSKLNGHVDFLNTLVFLIVCVDIYCQQTNIRFTYINSKHIEFEAEPASLRNCQGLLVFPILKMLSELVE